MTSSGSPAAPLLDELQAGASRLGLPLDARAADRLIAYLGLLQRWNGVYNLTSVRTPDAMLRQHLLDCIAVIPPLAAATAGRRRPVRLLDVGSGGGLPGVVIAIVCPEFEVTCVDTVGKKAAFIRQCGAELGLSNLRASHARVEALTPPTGGFDIVTSRAFASLGDFVRLTDSLLAADGEWMAMKGRSPEDELAALPSGVVCRRIEPLRVPGLDAERCLVWLSRDRAPV